MKFIEINIYTTHDGIEPVTGRLYALGINGVEIMDKADFGESIAADTATPDNTEKKAAKNFSDEVNVKAYVCDNVSGCETLKYIKSSIEQLKCLDSEHAFGRLEIELSDTSDEDWANNWKQYYKPTRVGRHVVIVPKWENYDAAPEDVIVKIDPGATFGSGTHETTRLCIEFIEEMVTKNTRLLDIGTGSGILAVTALKLGAKSALGTDIDGLAAEMALENARLNEVEAKFKAQRGNFAENIYGTYNIITANIVADAIIALAPDIPSHLSLGGIFIASGIIVSRENEVREQLSDGGLCVFDSKMQNNWVALACKRK